MAHKAIFSNILEIALLTRVALEKKLYFEVQAHKQIADDEIRKSCNEISKFRFSTKEIQRVWL